MSGYLPTQGRIVTLQGFLTREAGERIINAYNTSIGPLGTIPAPLGMSNSQIGGNAGLPGITIPGSFGLLNTGLLVTTWGRVIDKGMDNNGNDFFYLDDGSGMWDGGYLPGGAKRTGVRATINYVSPPIGSYQRVTGVSSVEILNGAPQRRLLPRGPLDVRQLAAPPP